MKDKYITFRQFTELIREVPRDFRIRWLFEFFKPKKRLHLFGKFFFPNVIKGDYETPDCHLLLISELSSDRNSAIIFPRGHAKTTWEKIDTLHDIVYKLESVILYISNTITDAQFHFDAIKAELENNDLLKEVYGDLTPLTLGEVHWTSRHFETRNGVNVIARGAGKGRGINIKNQRPSKIIIDDSEDDEMVQSPDRRQKFYNWLYNVIFPSVNPERSKIKMIGTVLHRDCELLRFHKKHGGIFLKAIEKGKSIWEEMFSLRDLSAIKHNIGSRSFSQEYMNDPSSDGAIIKREWIKYYNRKNLYLHEGRWWYNDKGKTIEANAYMGIDPAVSQKQTADDRAIETVASYHKDFKINGVQINKSVILAISDKADKWSPSEFAETLVRLKDLLKPQTIGCESNATQDLFRHWFNMYEISTTAINPDKDKVRRLNQHTADIEFGYIMFPDDGSCDELIDELIAFTGLPNGSDNRVDAFVYALSLAKSFSSTTPEQKKIPGVAGNLFNKKF